MILLLRTSKPSDCAPVNALDMFISHYFLGSGAPQTLIQSCLTFGTFSYIIEKLSKQQPALALPPATGVKPLKGAAQNVLAPFTLPLPHDALDGFSTFQDFLSKLRGN
jgi:mitochondrial import inner membrane translocase subunit TIM22